MDIKVGKMGTPFKEIPVEDGTTVADALRMADIEVGTNVAITIDDENVSLTDEVNDGDKIVVGINSKDGSLL